MKDGKYRRFFPVGMRLPEGTYPTKMERIILGIVEERPGITQKEIANELRITQPTVSYHINRLKELGRIRTERHGITLRHYLVYPEI
ncbi:MAG: winged helix-turn-helix transcriptional regulator [Thermoplasmata archaeon]